VYYPAVSFAHAERCTLTDDFGALPFEYDYFLDPPTPAAPAGAELEASKVDERVQGSRNSALEIRPAQIDPHELLSISIARASMARAGTKTGKNQYRDCPRGYFTPAASRPQTATRDGLA